MPVEQCKFEWTATLININTGMNQELLKKCKALGGYVTFVDKVRIYSKSIKELDQAGFQGREHARVFRAD